MRGTFTRFAFILSLFAAAAWFGSCASPLDSDDGSGNNPNPQNPGDTIFITDTIYLSDSTSGGDTVYVTDTVYLEDSTGQGDTVFVYDTIIEFDTTFVVDTLIGDDTIYVIDTIASGDTVFVTDTIVTNDTIEVVDTVVNVDTLVYTDTFYQIDTVIDTVFDNCPDSLADTLVDTVFIVDTVEVGDTVIIVDTVCVNQPDTTDYPKYCEKFTENDKEEIWQYNNPAGKYRIEFKSYFDYKEAPKYVVLYIDGKRYEWDPKDNKEFVVHQNLSANAKIKAIAIRPHDCDFRITICVDIFGIQ